MTPKQIFEKLVDIRGLKDEPDFFDPKYEDLHDPLKLPDIQLALKRLKKAKKNEEIVAIYGDYDIDGLAAVALLSDAFSSFGIQTIPFIPDRFSDGYGLSESGLDSVIDQGATLVVTVDCGSSSESEIAYAKKKGLDVIVTDHHSIPTPPKSAIAVINAKRKDSEYPFSERSGGGIAFGLVQAMQKSGFKGLEDGQEKWLLDLVALSTISDIVDLLGENRILARFGLQVLSKTKRPGIRSLIELSDVNIDELDEIAIGFRIGPRLNAAGRITHAQLALEALMTDDDTKAFVIAEELNQLNVERQNEQAKISRDAIRQATESDDAVLVLSDKKWSHGINGIVASKLVERFGKPTFVMQELSDGMTKGSARSIGDFDLAKALQSCKKLLVSGGGHKFAAGATIKTKDFDEFKVALNDYYKKTVKTEAAELLKPSAEIELSSIEGLTIGLSEMLKDLKPFGQGNPEPVFKLKDVFLTEVRLVGADKQHAQTVIQDGDNNLLNSIGFSMAEKVTAVGDEAVTVYGRLGRNDFRDQPRVQFVISYIDM